MIETGGEQHFRLGKDRRNHNTYLEIDGARHIDIPYKMRAPLARGEMKDTVVGDLRLVKFPLRKAGKSYSLLLSHDATNLQTRLQLGKHKVAVTGKALNAAEGLWPMNLNIEDLNLGIEVHYNAEANTFDLNIAGQSYA